LKKIIFILSTILIFVISGTVQSAHYNDPKDEKEIPGIWIWTFSRLPEEYQKNECFIEAVKLAEKIAKSKKGQKAFGKVNNPGQNLNKEEVDKTGKHPEIEVKVPTSTSKKNAAAWYDGESGGPKDTLFFNKVKLDKALDLCKKSKKLDSIIYIASTLLHETAHWKDDVIKFPNADGRPFGDTFGEEGEDLVVEIFGGVLDLDREGNLRKNLKKVDKATKEKWANPKTWD
jgi:hypothetical protein